MEKQLVPAGYKQTEVGVIPEDWDAIQVQDVCDFIVPGRNKPLKFDGDIPWITTPDLTDSRVVYSSRAGLKISKEEAKSVGSKIVPEGSVIMSCVGELGLVAIAGRNIVLNQQLHAFLPSGKINNYYLAYALKDQESYFYSAATKTALPYLNKDNCNATPLPLPPMQEQTAIANALSDVDALIAALEKLINKKSAIKIAAMQQLLTGKKRLPPFDQRNTGYKQTELGEIPGDWEVSTLERVSSQPMQNGLFYEPNRKGKGVYLINVGDMYKSAPISVGELELFDANAAEKKTFKVISGDLFFTRSSIVPSGIAYCNIYESQVLDCELVFDSHLIRLRTNSNIANARYTYLACMATYARKFLIGSAKTATMTTIDQGALKKCPILLPPLEEQFAIANVLSDMDKDLEALQQRLHKTQQIKQGMMQELLTGKTRLGQGVTF